MDNKRLKEQKSNTEEIRLNKFLSDAGFCSRRQADRLIEEGHVKVNNETALMGQRSKNYNKRNTYRNMPGCTHCFGLFLYLQKK